MRIGSFSGNGTNGIIFPENSSNGAKQVCTVCTDTALSEIELECGHQFHKSCATKALTTKPNGMRCPNCRCDITNGDKITIYELMTEKEPNKAKWRHNLALCQMRSTNTDQHQIGLTNLLKSIEIDQYIHNTWLSLADNWPEDKREVNLRLDIGDGEPTPIHVNRLQAYSQVLELDPNNDHALQWIAYLAEQPEFQR